MGGWVGSRKVGTGKVGSGIPSYCHFSLSDEISSCSTSGVCGLGFLVRVQRFLACELASQASCGSLQFQPVPVAICSLKGYFCPSRTRASSQIAWDAAAGMGQTLLGTLSRCLVRALRGRGSLRSWAYALLRPRHFYLAPLALHGFCASPVPGGILALIRGCQTCGLALHPQAVDSHLVNG